MKAFKYFDLNNNGTVEPDEFAKAIEKIGIMIPTKQVSLPPYSQDLDALFSVYDADRSGALDYKEFSVALYGHSVAGGASPAPSANATSNMADLAEKLQKKLASRGARGIIGLGKSFRIMDDNNSRSLDIHEFRKAMNDYMLGFSETEINKLFEFFDVDGSGACDYDEFLRQLRGPMNPRRKKIVAQAYAKIDRDGNGYVDINDIKGVYNASQHPDVLQGKKTEDQILMEFLETFETHHSCRNNNAPDHIVTKEEFEEYYNNISSSCPNDDYFELMMNNAWKLNDGNKTYGKGWATENSGKSTFGTMRQPQPVPRPNTSQRIFNSPGIAPKKAAPIQEDMNYSEKQLVEAFRKALAKRGGRGIFGLGRQFKIADDDNSKALSLDEFKKCVHDFRVGIAAKDAERLYKVFDRSGDGAIDYDEFLRGVRGEMNQFRASIAKKAFVIMDKDKSGVLNADDIRQSYSAKKHPDVIAGKKTEDEVLGEFLDTFESHYAQTHPNSRDGNITMDEWLEYYNNVSMSVDRDDYFELMMNNTWNLDGSRVTKKGWGGEV